MERTPREEAAGALALLAFQNGPRNGEEIPVTAPVVDIGQGAQNDMVLPDDSVSARHARLEFDEGAWRITDLDSTNGTYVESVRLAPGVRTPIPYGASLRLGGVRLHLRHVPDADPAAARAEYVEPEPRESIRERVGTRFPLWAVALVVVLVVALVLFLVFGPVDLAATPLAGLLLPAATALPAP